MKRFPALLFVAALIALTNPFLLAEGPTLASGKTAATIPTGDSSPISDDSAKSEMADPIEVDRLYGRLEADHGYLPEIDPVSSFNQAAPALTPEAADLALRQAAAAAKRLVATSSRLEILITDFEAKRISSANFETRWSETLEQLEILAAQIQSDVYLEILDRMLDRQAVQMAPGIFQQAQLVLQARKLAEEIQRGVDSHRRHDRVDAADLRRPNLGSMAGSIQQLTRTLRNSEPPAAR